MSRRRVLWGEGMFLRPHHFQQLSHYIDAASTDRQSVFKRYVWGAWKVEIDQEMLKRGSVVLNELSLVFQDGTLYNIPNLLELPRQRNINDISNLSSSTRLYACLPQLKEYGENLFTDVDERISTRYKLCKKEVHDFYTNSLPSEISYLDLNVSIKFEEENRDGFFSIPILQIFRNDMGEWVVDEAFSPPMVNIKNFKNINDMLMRLLDIILLKNKALIEQHRERSKKVSDFGAMDVGLFWLTHTVSKSYIKFKHLYLSHIVHPEELYLTMSEFCSELMTFSSKFEIEDIPAYKHDSIFEVFTLLDQQIRVLMETVISTKFIFIPLTTSKPSFYIGTLDNEQLLDGADFYISVSGAYAVTDLVENVPIRFKVGSPDDVERILNSAMNGVQLNYLPQVPSSIPIKAGNHYFMLDDSSQIYTRMLRSRSICIYVPQMFNGLKLELLAILR